MNAKLAKAIRNAEAFLLGRQYNRPLHPQPQGHAAKPVPVLPPLVPTPAASTSRP